MPRHKKLISTFIYKGIACSIWQRYTLLGYIEVDNGTPYRVSVATTGPYTDIIIPGPGGDTHFIGESYPETFDLNKAESAVKKLADRYLESLYE